jgi:hypothetical protein
MTDSDMGAGEASSRLVRPVASGVTTQPQSVLTAVMSDTTGRTNVNGRLAVYESSGTCRVEINMPRDLTASTKTS